MQNEIFHFDPLEFGCLAFSSIMCLFKVTDKLTFSRINQLEKLSSNHPK